MGACIKRSEAEGAYPDLADAWLYSVGDTSPFRNRGHAEGSIGCVHGAVVVACCAVVGMGGGGAVACYPVVGLGVVLWLPVCQHHRYASPPAPPPFPSLASRPCRSLPYAQLKRITDPNGTLSFRLDMDAKTLTVSVKGRKIARFTDVTGTVYPAVWFWERCVHGRASIQGAFTVRGEHTKVR